MGEVIRFPTRTRVGDRVRNVPFSDAASHVERLLAGWCDNMLDCQLRFEGNDRVTIIVGWIDLGALVMPYDCGGMHEIEEILGLYQAALKEGTEPNPGLATFYRTLGDESPAWVLHSEECVKFPLRAEVEEVT